MLLLYADYKEEGLYEKNIYFGPLRFRVLLHSVRSTEPIFLLRKKLSFYSLPVIFLD